MTPRMLAHLQAEDHRREVGHEILAATARGFRHLTPEQRAEAERLIALPYGAEGYALRAFVANHYQTEAERLAAQECAA